MVLNMVKCRYKTTHSLMHLLPW